MNWTREYKKIFLKELSNLPIEARVKIEKLIFQTMQVSNPFEIFNLEKMTGYFDKYKIRIGSYRIGITLETKSKRIIFCRVAHRKDIYKIFP